jgi:hypothetical protein
MFNTMGFGAQVNLNTPGAYDWLAKNAGKFGLKNLHGEPWHSSPSGT